jgi:hypothetical protein
MVATLASWPAGRAAEAVGPVQITACTTITDSGSYILVNNLTPAVPGDCLIIQSDFVTIDLNGFLIRGIVLRPNPRVGRGIIAEGRRGITIRNGAIADFESGIVIVGRGVEIDRIRAFSNRFWGISVGNVGDPLTNSGFALITGSIVSQNGVGIRVGGPGTIIGNSSLGNSIGIGAGGPGSSVVNNTATFNDFGIVVNCPSALIGNSAVENGVNLSLTGSGCVNAHNAAP